MSDNTEKKYVLILTASGGGGLIQAAKAKEQEINEKDPEIEVIIKDIMIDWLGFLGKFGVNGYNQAQRKGKVNSQETWGKLQIYADIVFWPTLFFRSLSLLLKKNVVRIIDTQPLCTSAYVKAIRIVNWLKKTNLILEKNLVDMPTKKSTHFFRGIKFLSKLEKKYIRIETIHPLLENEKDENDFWLKYCGVSEKQVYYNNCDVRSGFKAYIGKKRNNDPFNILIRTKENKESEYVQEIIKHGNIEYKNTPEGNLFSISPTDKLFVVILGSQPSVEGTSGYVKNFINLLKLVNNKEINYNLFVFCDKFSKSKKNLFIRVKEIIEKEKDYPSNLSIIPMSFQEADSVGSLFHRSDISITRSGGQTIKELIVVCSGEMFIHSEAKKPKDGSDLNDNQLLKGIPGWESGNAEYFAKKNKGKLITPDILIDKVKQYI
jgi:hypothetical protein